MAITGSQSQFFGLLLWLLCLAGLTAQRGFSAVESNDVDSSQWSRYVQEFRRNHHFALTFSSIQGTVSYAPAPKQSRATYGTTGLAGIFEYSFHLPIGARLGYLLGSSMGVTYEEVVNSGALTIGPVWRLPGFVIGAVWNISPRWSLLGNISTYLERSEQVTDYSGTSARHQKTTVRANYDVAGILEFYREIFWGVRLEYHLRELLYVPPERAQDHTEDFEMVTSDRWIGMGVVYHAL